MSGQTIDSSALLASRKAFEEQWEKEHGTLPHGDDVAELNWIATRNKAAKWWIRGFKEANKVHSMTEAEKIYQRMYRRRLDGNAMQDWRWVDDRQAKELGGTVERYIESLLEQGFRVTAGYLTTKVRDYHEHHILFKPRKKKKPEKIMTRGELLKFLEKEARVFRKDHDHYKRNSHMHNISDCPPQDVIDAVLVGFINHVGATQCLDYGLYTKHIAE